MSNNNNGMPAVSTVSDMPPNLNKPSSLKKWSGGGNKKGTSAERRATHNAVERARRESLNVRFLELAANLPATCSVRRPSKSLIVNQSLEFVRQALNVDSVLRLKVDEVMAENQMILEELNNLRQESGLGIRTSNIETNLPAPLAKNDFSNKARRATLALSRGSFSLGGDFDDECSGQASNSSVSSTGSPTDPFPADSLTTTATATTTNSSVGTGFHPSPNMSENSGGHYLFNTAQSYPDPNFHHQQPPSSTFSLPSSYYYHDSSLHSHHPQQPPQQLTSDYMPPITPTTAAMFSHIMDSYPTPGVSNNCPQPNGSPSLDDRSHTTFAAMASNTFFDPRHSKPVSSGPSSGPYTTAV